MARSGPSSFTKRKFKTSRHWAVPRMRSDFPWNALVYVLFSVAFTLFFAPQTFEASDFWTWHGFDVSPVKTSKFEWVLHTRIRTRSGDLQQGRTGTILRFNAHRQFSVITGYYYGKEEDAAEEWRNFHRIFSGVEVPVFQRRKASVATRGLVERFISDARPDFTRFRQRVRYSTTDRIGPYAQGEWFFDAKGYLSGRYSGGLRWRWTRSSWVELGYLYDVRRPEIGPSRHVFVTNFLLERRKN